MKCCQAQGTFKTGGMLLLSLYFRQDFNQLNSKKDSGSLKTGLGFQLSDEIWETMSFLMNPGYLGDKINLNVSLCQ